MVVRVIGEVSFVMGGIAALGLTATLVTCAATDDTHPGSKDHQSTQPQAGAPPARRCGRSDVVVALGRHGAWHGMTAQNVTMRNAADKPCALHSDEVRHVVVGFGDDRWIEVDLSALGGSRFLLQPGRGVSLMFGADASGAACGPIARTSGAPIVVSPWINERATRECSTSPTMATVSLRKSCL